MERLEQMIDITREIEEEKSEYRTVTSYLNDVQKLEDLPEPEKEKNCGCGTECRSVKQCEKYFP